MGWFSITCRRIVGSRSMVDLMVDRDIMVNRVVDIMVVMTMMHHVSHMWILLHVIQWHTQVEHCLQAERMTSHFSMW